MFNASRVQWYMLRFLKMITPVKCFVPFYDGTVVSCLTYYPSGVPLAGMTSEMSNTLALLLTRE